MASPAAWLERSISRLTALTSCFPRRCAMTFLVSCTCSGRYVLTVLGWGFITLMPPEVVPKAPRMDAPRSASKRLEAPRSGARRRAAARGGAGQLEWLSPPFIGSPGPEILRIADGDPVLGRDAAPSVAECWKCIVELAPEVVLVASCGFRVDQ